MIESEGVLALLITLAVLAPVPVILGAGLLATLAIERLFGGEVAP